MKRGIDIQSIKRVSGILLMIFGVALLINGYLKDVIYFINLGVGLIVVGWILLIFTFERCIEYSIVSHVLDDYIELVKRLIKGLNIKTGAVIIPPGENLKHGCIFLPFHENFKVNLSIMDDYTLFVNSDNRDEMGILLPPLGRGLRRLLKKYRGEYSTSLEDRDINLLLEDLEYLLSLLAIGGDVKVETRGDEIIITYKIGDNSLCKRLQEEDLCRRYPCPVCGALVLTVAEFLNKVLKIEEIKEENRKVLIKLRIIRDVLE